MSVQRAVPREDIPIPYVIRTVKTSEIVRGFTCKEVKFECSKYDNRTATQKADYDRLEASIREHGISDPIIAWKHPQTGQIYALIGMRRHEIAWKVGIEHLVIAEVQEDIRNWVAVDVSRVNRLKRELGQRAY